MTVEFSQIVFEIEILNGDSNSTSDTFVTSFLYRSLRFVRKISEDRTSELHWRYLNTSWKYPEVRWSGMGVCIFRSQVFSWFFHSGFTPPPLRTTTECGNVLFVLPLLPLLTRTKKNLFHFLLKHFPTKTSKILEHSFRFHVPLCCLWYSLHFLWVSSPTITREPESLEYVNTPSCFQKRAVVQDQLTVDQQ